MKISVRSALMAPVAIIVLLFSGLAAEAPASAAGSSVTIVATPKSETTGTATITNTSAGSINGVLFAIANNGSDVTQTPDPGATSFPLNAGESVTVDYSILPLPSGVTSYYLMMLPVLGDLELGRSSLVSYAATLLPQVVTAPKLVATSIRVGVPIKGTFAFTGATSYTCRWKRADAGIVGATKCTYTPTYLDYGKRLALIVTATNSAGSTTVISAPSAVVALGYAPKIVAPYYPKIVGTPTRGRYISINVGKWTPTPTSYRCTLYRYSGTKAIRIGTTFKCVTGTKLKVPTAYPRYTKFGLTVATVKAGYASGVRVIVFKSR